MGDVALKPYLIRAIYQWCTDSGNVPYIEVAVTPQMGIPSEFVQNNRIILNIGGYATKDLSITDQHIDFMARFSGKVYHLLIPISRVISCFSRETGQGMTFDFDDSQFEEKDIQTSVSEDIECEKTTDLSNHPTATSLRVIK